MSIGFTNRPGMTNPMTTGGDVIYGGASGVPTRLANGSANQVLTSQGTTLAPIWAAATAAPAYTYVSQSSALNPAALGSYYVLSGASFGITLPTAASVAGQGFVFQHAGTSLSQVYTFSTTSAQTIGGVASGSYALYTNGEVLALVSDGANWQIQNHKTDTGWISAGTTVIGAVSIAPTKGNTVSIDRVLYKRLGDTAIIKWEYLQTSATGSNAGSGVYLPTLPSNMTIDTAKISTSTSTSGIAAARMPAYCGYGEVANGTGQAIGGACYAYDSTKISCSGGTPFTAFDNWNSAFFPFTATTLGFSWMVTVPISGWQP